jgi:hypothetical protein
LNLLRAFGTGLGVAASSTLLTWRLEPVSGAHGRTFGVSEKLLLGAVQDTMLMLAAFAVSAAAASLLLRPVAKPAR